MNAQKIADKLVEAEIAREALQHKDPDDQESKT